MVALNVTVPPPTTVWLSGGCTMAGLTRTNRFAGTLITEPMRSLTATV